MYRITNKTGEARVCVSRTGAQNIVLPNGSILLEKMPKNLDGFGAESVSSRVEEVGTEPVKSEVKKKIKLKEETS